MLQLLGTCRWLWSPWGGAGQGTCQRCKWSPGRFLLTQGISRALQREQDQEPLKSHSLCLSIYELINIKQLLSGVQA